MYIIIINLLPHYINYYFNYHNYSNPNSNKIIYDQSPTNKQVSTP